MENYVSAQLGQLGAAVALGAAAGLVYDLLRAVRLIDRRDHWLTHLLDALFTAVLGLGLLWLTLVVGGGELRLYMISGALLGAVIWFGLLSRLLRPVWDFWTAALLALCRMLWMPFALLLRGAKKLAAYIKKGFSFLKKCATIKVAAWRSRAAHHETSHQEGEAAVSGNAKRKKAKKHSPAIVLLVVILLAVLSVQIINVYGQLRDAQQEEAALNQQLTEQQQENDALRSDLEKKDDESFIKALARDLLGLAEEGERIFYDVND